MADVVVDLATARRERECSEELEASLEELALVVELALARLRAHQRWSGTDLLLSGLTSLARDVRHAAAALAAATGEDGAASGEVG